MVVVVVVASTTPKQPSCTLTTLQTTDSESGESYERVSCGQESDQCVILQKVNGVF